MTLPLLLLACTAPSDTTPVDTDTPGDPSTADTDVPAVEDTTDTAGPTDTAAPTTTTPPTTCAAVEAIFFDLGETLVTWDGDIFQPRPGAAETVAALKAAGIRVGVITNTEPWWDLQDLRDLLAEPDLLDAFEVVLMSSEAQSPPKPAPGIYLEAHARMVGGPPIAQTAFVTEELPDLADDAVAPTEGARAAGMFGVWLGDGPSPLADAVSPYDDLPALVVAPWLSCP